MFSKTIYCINEITDIHTSRSSRTFDCRRRRVAPHQGEDISSHKRVAPSVALCRFFNCNYVHTTGLQTFLAYNSIPHRLSTSISISQQSNPFQLRKFTFNADCQTFCRLNIMELYTRTNNPQPYRHFQLSIHICHNKSLTGM